VLSQTTQCPFSALSFQEALCAFGVPFGSPGVVAIATSSTPIHHGNWHVVAVYDANDLRGVIAGLLGMWRKEVCTAFALVAPIAHVRQRHDIDDVVARRFCGSRDARD